MENKIDYVSELENPTDRAIDEARFLIESFDECGAITVDYDKPYYRLSSEQMKKISKALYLAECEISYLRE